MIHDVFTVFTVYVEYVYVCICMYVCMYVCMYSTKEAETRQLDLQKFLASFYCIFLYLIFFFFFFFLYAYLLLTHYHQRMNVCHYYYYRSVTFECSSPRNANVRSHISYVSEESDANQGLTYAGGTYTPTVGVCM